MRGVYVEWGAYLKEGFNWPEFQTYLSVAYSLRGIMRLEDVQMALIKGLVLQLF